MMRSGCFRRLSLSFACILLSPLNGMGCKTTSRRAELTSAAQDLSAAAAAEFRMLSARYTPYTVQDDPAVPDDCGPFYMPADPSVPYRGTALLLHGFTACPQQFYEFSTILAKKGFASMVPLLPGQGRAPTPDGSNKRMIDDQKYQDFYSAYLPSVKDEGWRRYADFISELNTFMSNLPGEKVVGGLSAGGALANFAYLERPGLYQRALLLSPYYGMPGPHLPNSPSPASVQAAKFRATHTLYQLQKFLVNSGTKTIGVLGHLEYSWGADCYAKTIDRDGRTGRRGICDFREEHLAALNAFGDFVLDALKTQDFEATPPQIMFVHVDGDGAANNVLTRKAIALQTVRWGEAKVSSCFYPEDVPHSYFSRADLSPDLNPSWRHSFLAQGTNFLAQSTAFKLEGRSEEVVFDSEKNVDTTKKLSRCAIFAVDYPAVFNLQ